MQNLRKVDFFWINRDQKSFEWFLNLLSEMEAEQENDFDCTEDCEKSSNDDAQNLNKVKDAVKKRFLDIHLYFTQALQRNDMRAVGMHLAMDLLHRKVRRFDF